MHSAAAAVFRRSVSPRSSLTVPPSAALSELHASSQAPLSTTVKLPDSVPVSHSLATHVKRRAGTLRL